MTFPLSQQRAPALAGTHSQPLAMLKRYGVCPPVVKARKCFNGLTSPVCKISSNGGWRKLCHYCTNAIPTIGLDRVDNFKGYYLDNIVACCRLCNLMKRDLPCEVFLEQCRKVANHLP